MISQLNEMRFLFPGILLYLFGSNILQQFASFLEILFFMLYNIISLSSSVLRMDIYSSDGLLLRIYE